MIAQVHCDQFKWHFKIHCLEAKCRKIFWIFKDIFPESDALECAYYLFNRFTWMPRRNTLLDIMNFAIAKNIF